MLALSARSEDKLKAVNQELGGHHQVVPVDVTDTKTLVKSAESIDGTFPRIDSVVFMAAAYEPAQVDKLDIDQTHKIVDINLNGAFNTVHAVLPILTAQGDGQLVLCGSVAGYRGLPSGQAYSATKAALINLAESLHTERQDLDIKVINPGFVRTPLTEIQNADDD